MKRQVYGRLWELIKKVGKCVNSFETNIRSLHSFSNQTKCILTDWKGKKTKTIWVDQIASLLQGKKVRAILLSYLNCND